MMKKVLFGGSWSVMIWCLIIGMTLVFTIMGLTAIGVFPEYFYSVCNLIGSITGATMGGLLLFMIPLSIIWNKDKETRIVLIVLSVVACLLNAIFQNNTKAFGIFMLVFIASTIISCATVRKTK